MAAAIAILHAQNTPLPHTLADTSRFVIAIVKSLCELVS